MVHLGPGELHESPGVVIELEVADDAEDQGILERVGAGDGIVEGVPVEGLMAIEDVLA